MIDTLRLTAEDALGLLERGAVSAAELHAAYSEAIAARDPELHAFLTLVDEPDGDGVPIALLLENALRCAEYRRERGVFPAR